MMLCQREVPLLLFTFAICITIKGHRLVGVAAGSFRAHVTYCMHGCCMLLFVVVVASLVLCGASALLDAYTLVRAI